MVSSAAMRSPGGRCAIWAPDACPSSFGHKPRVEGNFDSGEGLRYGAVRPGCLGMLCKGGLIQAAHSGLAGDLALRDLETAVLGLHRDVRRRIHIVRREASQAQDQRQRHRKAARMGRRQQLFRISPRTVLEPRGERYAPLNRPFPKSTVPLPSLSVPSHRACALRVGMKIPFDRAPKSHPRTCRRPDVCAAGTVIGDHCKQFTVNAEQRVLRHGRLPAALLGCRRHGPSAHQPHFKMFPGFHIEMRIHRHLDDVTESAVRHVDRRLALSLRYCEHGLCHFFTSSK